MMICRLLPQEFASASKNLRPLSPRAGGTICPSRPVVDAGGHDGGCTAGGRYRWPAAAIKWICRRWGSPRNIQRGHVCYRRPFPENRRGRATRWNSCRMQGGRAGCSRISALILAVTFMWTLMFWCDTRPVILEASFRDPRSPFHLGRTCGPSVATGPASRDHREFGSKRSRRAEPNGSIFAELRSRRALRQATSPWTTAAWHPFRTHREHL
jgi:hypothetical protein